MKRSNQRGFTLLELMVTVAVVGILAGIAYPAYQGQIRSTRRADAQAELLQMANFMERFFTENSRYDQDMTGTAVSLPPPTGNDPKYAYALNPVGPGSYTLRATPIGPQTGDGFLELTDSGVRRWDKNHNNAIEATENTWEK
ncbi:MAG: type IV pilin protein [Gammaproteobacteria bacterium]